jgi:hypothetical protein
LGTPKEIKMKNLGLVGIKSVHGAYLQAHYPEGELHASNSHRNQEETWILYEIDANQKQYGLMNWRNGQFIQKTQEVTTPIFGRIGGGCALAKATVVDNYAVWVFVLGTPFGISNAVGLRCVADGTYLGANAPGNDTGCGGEVASSDPKPPPQNDGTWPGWWVIEPATEPSPGTDFWNTAGNAIGQLGQLIKNNLNAADVATLMKMLL